MYNKPAYKNLERLRPLKNFFSITCFLLLCLINEAGAFDIPERLEYDLKWSGIKAGTAVVEVIKEKEGVKIISTATSTKWVSAFYHVEDRVESRGDSVPGQKGDTVPINYRIKLKEGRHRRDKEVIFNHDAKKVIYIDHLKAERHESDITGKVFDPLSGFYHIRDMDLKIGESVYVPVFDSKKFWNVEVKVLRKETLKLPSGTFDTIVVMPLMESEGIFSRKGDIYIWLTDDDKKIPVQLKSKVKIGSVTATLVGGKY